MKRLFTLSMMLLSLAALALPQDLQRPPAAEPVIEPQYVLAAGLGFNRADTPQAKGWGTFAARVADKTYSLSTLDITSANSSMRTGIARVFYRSGGFSFLALVDAGVVTGQQQIGGAFSGGGLLTYDLSKWSKVAGAFAVGGVRVVQLAGNGVSPTFSFGFGKTF